MRKTKEGERKGKGMGREGREGSVMEGRVELEGRGKGREFMGAGEDMRWDGEGREMRKMRERGEGLQAPNFNFWQRHCLQVLSQAIANTSPVIDI